jgi:hypothetical protein
MRGWSAPSLLEEKGVQISWPQYTEPTNISSLTETEARSSPQTVQHLLHLNTQLQKEVSETKSELATLRNAYDALKAESHMLRDELAVLRAYRAKSCAIIDRMMETFQMTASIQAKDVGQTRTGADNMNEEDDVEDL